MRKISIALLVALLFAAVPLSLCAADIPAGTHITVTLDQSVSSKNARVGQHVPASVARDVVVGGKTLIPRGSQATLIVASAQSSGRLSKPGKLWLRMHSVQVNGKSHGVSTNLQGRTMGSKATRDTVAIGGGAGAGALFCGLAGGGKGAAIGAGGGARAGTAGGAGNREKEGNYPPETRLYFTTRPDTNNIEKSKV